MAVNIAPWKAKKRAPLSVAFFFAADRTSYRGGRPPPPWRSPPPPPPPPDGREGAALPREYEGPEPYEPREYEGYDPREYGDPYESREYEGYDWREYGDPYEPREYEGISCAYDGLDPRSSYGLRVLPFAAPREAEKRPHESDGACSSRPAPLGAESSPLRVSVAGLRRSDPVGNSVDRASPRASSKRFHGADGANSLRVASTRPDAAGPSLIPLFSRIVGAAFARSAGAAFARAARAAFS